MAKDSSAKLKERARETGLGHAHLHQMRHT
jgi:hypothetical protein